MHGLANGQKTWPSRLAELHTGAGASLGAPAEKKETRNAMEDP